MIRRLPIFCALLFAAGCAASPPPQAPASPRPVPAARPPAAPEYRGMTAASLRQAMGAPAFVRKDGAMELWRYDGAACRAFFFLYDAQNAKLVRDVETLPHGTNGAADPGCLAALRLSPAKTS